jgi:hypothetical protein
VQQFLQLLQYLADKPDIWSDLVGYAQKTFIELRSLFEDQPGGAPGPQLNSYDRGKAAAVLLGTLVMAVLIVGTAGVFLFKSGKVFAAGLKNLTGDGKALAQDVRAAWGVAKHEPLVAPAPRMVTPDGRVITTGPPEPPGARRLAIFSEEFKKQRASRRVEEEASKKLPEPLKGEEPRRSVTPTNMAALRGELRRLAEEAYAVLEEARKEGIHTVRVGKSTLRAHSTPRGPVLTVVKDLQTGAVFYGQNATPPNLPGNLHPFLGKGLAEYLGAGNPVQTRRAGT